MKNLLKSLLFVFVALFAVDRIGGQIMWWVNQHTQDMSGPKLKYLANEVDADIVLLGTSRCNFHYVPSILSDSIGMSVYNGGIDASNCIYAHYFVLNQILLHHTPKIICLELMTSDYAVSANSFETTSFFAPYIGRSEKADSVFREAGNYWYYRLCHLYRYNAKAVSNMGGLLVNKQLESESGYIPLPRPMFVPERLDKVHKSKNIDELKLQYIRKFIMLCKSHHIALAFMVSPAYSEADTDLYGTLKDVAKENEIPFFDYHTQGLFLNHPEYFKDSGHLWDKGARLYTSIFAHDLKHYIVTHSTGN
ncbi:hypothetical protein [Odoribacter sp. Z80]|uniref:hypothetical protein n=1 Tax=Odoribacter sp. Z80 TaxID=2304575 RepID=UPI00137B24AA|nr:hypothetical protein [Odoribacter sp. Z80]NCE73203.1 hypothetical protein [Odoribacter sp. Z80]